MSKSSKGNSDLNKRNSIIKFCNKILIKNNINKINDKPLIKCSHKEIKSKYIEVTNDSDINGYLKKDTLFKEDYVYVIVNYTHNTCKIGYSNNPHKRLNQIQTGNHNKLKLFLVFKADKSTELKLHKKYKEYYLRGEWFRFEGKLKENLNNIKKENKFNIFV